MPNTLVHLGVQCIASKSLFPRSDLKWIMLGALIPDLPWILRRAINATGLEFNTYDFRAYTIVQATFLFCIILCAVFSLVSDRPTRVFTLLVFNSLLHLCLDSFEIKWGTGAQFLAPLDWSYFSLELIWPDAKAVLGITLLSVPIVLWHILKYRYDTVRIQLLRPVRLLGALMLGTVYLLAPLLLLEGAYSSDINSIATLRQQNDRIGQPVLMDRERYTKGEEIDYVTTFANEKLEIAGVPTIQSDSNVSLRGTFVDNHRITVEDIYVFNNPWRDIASYLGLLVIAAYWLYRLSKEPLGKTP